MIDEDFHIRVDTGSDLVSIENLRLITVGQIYLSLRLAMGEILCGAEKLPVLLEEMFGGGMPCDGSILTNARQYDACRRAYEAMLESLKGLKLGQTPDAVLTDVEAAMEAMGEVTGATVREDITARIFERFCVGK